MPLPTSLNKQHCKVQVMIDIMFLSSFYCHFVIVKGGTSYAFKSSQKSESTKKNMQADDLEEINFCPHNDSCCVRGIIISIHMTILSFQGNKFLMLSCEGNNHLASYDNVVMSGEYISDVVV